MDVESTLRGLTPEQKAGLASGADMWHLKAVDGMEPLVVTDGPHGVRKQLNTSSEGIKGDPATCFPPAVTLATSWDLELVHAVGDAIAAEAIALGVGVVLGPGANIKRHPLCGRNFEYFSEDPLLSGRLAAALIRGLEDSGVGSSLKHFVANNQESHRNVVDAVVDERALREIYLASFEYAVKEGRPATVMCGYNKVNGTYCSEHQWLLTTVLRDEWGFDGLVVSDWGAVNDRVEALSAGLELEMPGSGGVNDDELVAAYRSGRLSSEVLDRGTSRVLQLIDRTLPTSPASGEFDIDSHHALARRAAGESTVLLTNDGTLPLDETASIAVIGEFASRPRYQGAGSSQVTPTRLDNALDAMRETLGAERVTYSNGYVVDDDELRPDLIEAAVAAARQAEVAVVFVGLPGSYESEAYDREHMRLPEQHDQLVRAVSAANPRTIVVLSNGSSVLLPWASSVSAIVGAHLGGQAGGSAIVDVLFGRVNPSGKLAETYPVVQADHASDNFFPGEPRQVQYREGVYVGYRWFDTAGLDVAFPFGHGLSYTTFELGGLSVVGGPDADAPGFELTCEVDVTNVGERAGAEVVQVYVRPPRSAIDRPERELAAFAKVHLEPGESRRVTLSIDRRSLAYFDVASGQWQVESGRHEILVGTSSREIVETATVEVTSSHVPPATPEESGRGATLADFFDTAAFEARLGSAVPAPTPVRPFNRNSTLGEVASTPPGRALGKLVLTAAKKRLGGSLDESTTNMLNRALLELPLRSVVLLGGGKISWSALDRMIKVMNRWPGSNA